MRHLYSPKPQLSSKNAVHELMYEFVGQVRRTGMLLCENDKNLGPYGMDEEPAREGSFTF